MILWHHLAVSIDVPVSASSLTPLKAICKYRVYPCPIRLEPATRHYDEKLQQILKTSAKIFAEKGFHHTSVRDISRATKMSLSGLYYYFTTKEELLYLIQERCFVNLIAALGAGGRPQTSTCARASAPSPKIISVSFCTTCRR